MPLQHILLPYDGSVSARAALSHVRVLAGSEIAVTLVYAVPAYDVLEELGAGRDAARDARGMLNEAARGLRGPTTCALLEGDPAQAVAAEAERLGVDLVVLGCRGRSPLADLMLGSTARKLLAITTRPLLVVHSPVSAIRRLVVGVEEGAESVRLVTIAAAVAGRSGAEITLLNVVDADRELVARPDRYGIAADVWKAAVAHHLERVFAPLRGLVPGANEEVRYGPPAGQLRAAAEARAADIVVVARRGRSGRDVDAWFSVAFNLAVRGPFATLVC